MNVSVVCCTYNRSALLERTLRTVEQQQVPDAVTWEVVLVDNNSDDATPDVIERFAGRCPNVRSVRHEPQGLSRARNRGAEEANGELLCYIDDDVQLPADYVARAWAAYQDGGWDLAGGRSVPDYEIDPPKWLERLPRQKLNGPLGVHDRGEDDFILGPDDDFWPAGANMLIVRNIVDQVGGFNPELSRYAKSLRGGGDNEFYRRARDAGFTVGYSGSCRLGHWAPATRLTRRYFIRWNIIAGFTGMDEALPADTVFWLGVPRYEWRALVAAFFGAVGGIVTRNRMLRAIDLSNAFGRVAGYLTGRRTKELASPGPPD